MAFCANCGHQLVDGAKYCFECGKPVVSETGKDNVSLDVNVSLQVVLEGKADGYTKVDIYLKHIDKTVAVNVPNNIEVGRTIRLRGLGHTSPSGQKGDAYVRIAHIDYETIQQESSEPQRKVIYEGNIQKCPSCGESIPGFVASCPTCGHEFRGSRSTLSVRELSHKLEHASSDSVKANLIRNFPIPNTREDILEFMILASTNIENNFQQEVSEAWSVKFEQAYEKSKILYGEAAEFSRCYDLFLRKKEANQQALKRNEREEKRLRQKEEAAKSRDRASKFFEKNKEWMIPIGIFLALFLFVGSWSIPHAVKEHQLEKLVEEVEQCIDAGDFEAARRKANQIIDDSGWSTESEKKWNDIRESLLEAIAREEVLVGDKLYVGMSQKDMKGENYSNIVTHLERQGFTNVKTEAIADLITGWVTKDGSVEKVTINGSTDFDEGSAIEPDAEIVVYYHTFK